MAAFDAEFDRWLAAPPARQARLAAALAARGLPWEAWSAQFHRVHGRDLSREARAARVLREAYRVRDPAMAARFRFFEARAAQRAGSPREAAATYERCARDLVAAGDPVKGAQARVLRVDALAHAGRTEEALRLAKALDRDLRGAWAPPWRGALQVNVANAHRLRGDLDRALRAYDRAARTLRRHGQEATAMISQVNAGVALLDAGRAEEALERFDAARAAFQHAGLDDMALEARYNRACALVKAARLGEGLAELERLATEHAKRGLPRREALCRLDLAVALLRAGDLPAALEEADRAAEAFRSAHADAERAEALLVAAACAASDREATQRLRRAREAAASTGRTAIALRCDLKILDLAARRGAGVPAARWRAVLRRAEALGQEEIAAEVLLLLGDVALRQGRIATARARFEEAARAGRARPWVLAAARTGLASCLAREGKTARAVALLRRVTDFLDAVRAGLPGPWLRSLFVFRRLDPWLSRVEVLLARGRDADRAEAESVLDAIAARRFLERASPRAPRGRLDALRRRLEALYDRIGRGAGPSRGNASRHETSAAEALARRLEEEVTAAWRRRERERSNGQAALAADVTGLDERARPPLGEGVLALHVWIRDERVRALARDARTVGEAHDLGSLGDLRADLGRLAFHADRLRLFGAAPDGLADRAASGARPVPPEAPLLEAGLEALARRLLAPVLGWEPRPASLRLVLDPEVPDLPWEILPVDGKPLCATFRSLRVPCLRVRRSLHGSDRRTTYIALGDPNLPGVRMEMRLLAGRAKLLCGSQATCAALAAALAEPGLVHVAGHGFVSTDVPALGGVRLADGWFGTTDVPPEVAADLVVLAACRTGVEAGVAARAWGGLPAALLAAGARRVIWTTDDVDDAIGTELTLRLHGALAVAPGDPEHVERAFGRAVEDLWNDASMRVYLFPFRLSGVMP